MTAALTIFAVAAVTVVGHLVYGAILTGRDYALADRAWDRSCPQPKMKRVKVRVGMPGKARLQRA